MVLRSLLTAAVTQPDVLAGGMAVMHVVEGMVLLQAAAQALGLDIEPVPLPPPPPAAEPEPAPSPADGPPPMYPNAIEALRADPTLSNFLVRGGAGWAGGRHTALPFFTRLGDGACLCSALDCRVLVHTYLHRLARLPYPMPGRRALLLSPQSTRLLPRTLAPTASRRASRSRTPTSPPRCPAPTPSPPTSCPPTQRCRGC